MNQNESKKWLVIVNPNAGVKKGEKDWEGIAELLGEEGIIFEALFTERKYHAVEIAKEYIEKGYKDIIVVGGDGTMNEVINGLFLQKEYPTTDITLGMINIGTGKDWGRMYHIPHIYKKAIKTIKKGHTFIQDAGHVVYHDNQNPIGRYFANMAGMGYDALVAKMTNEMKEKGKGGTMAYLINLLKGLFKYKNTFLEITIDDEKVFADNVFSMSLGICKYNGGGMMQLPEAIPDDGILDITIIKKTTKFTVVKNIKNLYDGSFTKLPIVETFKGKKISIISKPRNTIFLETDGESLGHSPLEFSIIPKSIKLIVNKKFLKDI